MFPLQNSLSQHGFTASESYDHAVRCFLTNPTERIRCLNIDGDCGRRRTAFAHALAHSLDAEQVLYYEFGKDKPVPQIIRIQEGEEIVEEPPVEAFDRVLTEACAQSEAEHTVLILDQLNKTQFLNHIRLYEFLENGIWRYADVQYQANLLNLKVFMISDEPLYHSLQNSSFRIWINGSSQIQSQVSAIDLNLQDQDCAWLEPLQILFKHMDISPTINEYRRLAFDIEQHIRTEEQLKISLFGWLENVDMDDLQRQEIKPYLEDILYAIQQGLDVHEEIEISSIELPG